MNINIDGYGKAYHPANAQAGALIHLCNAGEVHLPNGSSYHGSVDNSTCTGRFMQDVARIGAAGWQDPKVGAVRWYGILGRGEARMTYTVRQQGKLRQVSRVVPGVAPVAQADGSGFYVSPTTFFDTTLADETDQRRYVNALRIPAAVVPNQPELSRRGVVMGSFGVAIDRRSGIAKPFVVGDFGPRVGEGTPALARSLAGLPITDDVTRAQRFAGQVNQPRILWIFFGSGSAPVRYRHTDEQALVRSAQEAFLRWGGEARLANCLRVTR
ncbi:hypothetical protein [Bosea sp. Root381]|uniref:hypothetical protein n=1 Tax=Bosea sp. Root381 TaxID=1736524 RepID=UPI001910A5DF|nr:hypothetical protein [Bosea sp. Root381]